MGINIQSIATTIEKFKINCGVERILPIKPELLKGLNSAELKLAPLEKDVINCQKVEPLHFNRNEIEHLKEKEFIPFLEKIQQGLKMEKNFDLAIKPETIPLSEGYCDSLNYKIEIAEKILLDPSFSKIALKTTGETVHFPINPACKNAKSFIVGKKSELEEIIASMEDWKNLFEAKTLTKDGRINLVKSNCIHESVHGKDIENIIKLEGVGVDNFVDNIIFSKKSRATETEENLIEYAQQMKASWAHLKNKENTIPLNSPLGRKTKKIWEHMLKQSDNTDPIIAQELYLNAPTEIRAYTIQKQLSEKLGLTF